MRGERERTKKQRQRHQESTIYIYIFIYSWKNWSIPLWWWLWNIVTKLWNQFPDTHPCKLFEYNWKEMAKKAHTQSDLFSLFVHIIVCITTDNEPIQKKHLHNMIQWWIWRRRRRKNCLNNSHPIRISYSRFYRYACNGEQRTKTWMCECASEYNIG